MHLYRLLFRSVLHTKRNIVLEQRQNVRLFASTVIELQSQIIYPNSDKKFGKYLDHLSEQINDTNLKEIRRKCAVRKSIVQQIIELENEMKDEHNAEILNLALDEKKVNSYRFIYKSITHFSHHFVEFH